MRAVVQRVEKANVTVDSKVIGSILQGILVFIGFQSSDGSKELQYMLDKIMNLRIFQDDAGKMNLSVMDLGGELLIIPNFTLYGDCRHGRRPSYSNAATPEVAKVLFNDFCALAKKQTTKIAQGEFQAEMKVNLINDGPITVMIDSDKTF